MKNLRKIFGIIALAALIGLTLAGCGESGDPSSPPPDKVAMPAANPPAGQVAGGTSVTLRCGTPGATIHYTTDGSAPTANSAEYFSSAPIPINAATTVKAIAVKPGMADSDILTAAYTVAVPPANTVAAPQASPAPGQIARDTSVTLSCSTDGAAIYYTTDGSAPTASSTAYSAPIVITETTTIKAIAVKTGMDDSAVLTAVYIISSTGQSRVATPMPNLAAGTYASAQSVTLSCATSGAVIYYTTNGSIPTASSAVYSSAISINATTTIKAIAVKAGMDNSEVLTAAYTITGGDGGGLTGTWTASGGRVIVFSGNIFNYKVNDVTRYSGTFSTSGSTITFVESRLGTASGNFQLSGGSLILSNHSWDTSVNGTYTLATASGGGDNPPSFTGVDLYTYTYNDDEETLTAYSGTGSVQTITGKFRVARDTYRDIGNIGSISADGKLTLNLPGTVADDKLPDASSFSGINGLKGGILYPDPVLYLRKPGTGPGIGFSLYYFNKGGTTVIEGETIILKEGWNYVAHNRNDDGMVITDISAYKWVINPDDIDDNSGKTDDRPVPQALCGEWVQEEDETNVMTISQETVTRTWVYDGGSRYFSANVIDVEPTTNTRTEENVNVDYPDGYKLPCIFTSHWDSLSIGTQTAFYLFLSVDGKKFWANNEAGDYSLPPNNVAVKR